MNPSFVPMSIHAPLRGHRPRAHECFCTAMRFVWRLHVAPVFFLAIRAATSDWQRILMRKEIFVDCCRRGNMVSSLAGLLALDVRVYDPP